jgi:hypothetical protein
VEEIAKERAAAKDDYGTNHDTHDDDNFDYDISSPIILHKYNILLADIASQIEIDLGFSRHDRNQLRYYKKIRES